MLVSVLVKSASRRSTHYDKKLDGDVWNLRITDLKDMMVEQVHPAYAVQALIEAKVKDYLEGIGMYGIQQHHYMNFAQGLWARSRSFTGNTLRLEAEIWASHWMRRNLDPAYLVHIAGFFGVDLTGWP